VLRISNLKRPQTDICTAEKPDNFLKNLCGETDLERSIVHINVADFAVAVERVLDPRLRDRPVIVAPEGAVRGSVYDMSEEAYRAGVRKGMALRRALRRCRDVRRVPPHPDRYEQAMKDMFRRALPYTPLIEPGDVDGHLFMDVTGTSRLFGPPVDVAWRLHKQVKADLGFAPIWSVAPNKLVAKVASRLVKPVGEYIVGAGEESSLLAPLPLFLIPGIETGDLRRLAEFNLSRVFQVGALTPEQLETIFGARARFLFDAVRGIDDSPVLEAGRKPPRVVGDHEFPDDTNTAADLEGALYGLVERAGADLRRQCRAIRRIGIIFDYSDGIRHIRQTSLQPASANDLVLFHAAQALLQRAWVRRVRIRHIRLIFDRLVFPPAQRELFPRARAQRRKRGRLVGAIDSIRNRFGQNAVHMGRTLAA